MRNTIPLGDLVSIRGGGTPSRGVSEYWGGEIPWATVKDFKSTTLRDTEETITHEAVRRSATNVIPAGSVIVPTRMAVGKAAMNSVDLAINQDLKALLPGSQVEPRFLLHFMLSNSRFLESQGQGATVKGIKLDLLRSLPFPRISRDEQRRIALILDKADAIRRKREHAVALADEFLRSVFFEMFGDLETNAKEWQTCKLALLLDVEPQNGLYRPSHDYGSGTSILRIDGFYDGYLVSNKPLKRLEIDAETVAKYQLRHGDIVINRVNSREYLGKCALIENLEDVTVFESNMMRFRVQTNRCSPRFLVDQFRSPFIKRQILKAAKDAVNQSSINQTDVRGFDIRLPPITLQNDYAAIVSKKRMQDKFLGEALEEAAHLFASLSQRAFRGEL